MAANLYIFPATGADFKQYGTAVSISALMVAIGLLVRLLAKKEWFLKRYVSWWFIIIGLVALMVYLFRYEQVLYFDQTAWIWMVFALASFGALWIFLIRLTYVPKIMEAKREQELKHRYIPKPKKR